jgi:ribosomal protein S27AE
VCGERGGHVDEDWRYYVVSGERVIRSLRGERGVAYLARVRVLCEKCHLTKHLGYASKKGEAE